MTVKRDHPDAPHCLPPKPTSLHNPSEDHTKHGADHTNPGADHTNPGADHTTPGAGHASPSADHTNRGEGHTNPGEDSGHTSGVPGPFPKRTKLTDPIMAAVQPSQKYDRQLRIWGEHGQSRLSSARICLLNAGPTGSEALKNLVLGGIGGFTIVDGTKVEASDLGNNFLLDFSSLGESKAQVVSNMLHELNDSVAPKFVEEDPETLIGSNPGFFKDFTLVIATQMPEALAVRLDGICRETGCQLIIARTYGLMGLLRISAPDQCVIESKPDNTVDDLRLHKPWPELQRLTDGYDLDIDDSAIHSHIPFVVILLKVFFEWNHKNGRGVNGQIEGHALRAPKTSEEKKEFKDLILSHRMSFDEENYKEASASAFKVWAPPTIDSDLKRILDDKASEVSPTSSDFWILVAALKGFMAEEGGGDVPLDGSIPDMHSFTESYIALQKVYRAKADADLASVERRVRPILKTVCNRDPDSIPKDMVKLFCKNSRNLRVLRYKSLKEEFAGKASAFELQRLMSSTDDPSHAGSLYLLLRAVDHFAQKFKRLPGSFDGDVHEEDITRLKSIIQTLTPQESVSPGGKEKGTTDGIAADQSVGEDLLLEMCRAGGCEVHCVAAVIGGIASQEAIKLITRQFVPLSGTLIYNAMSSTSAVLEL